jgi:hypothetical protein
VVEVDKEEFAIDENAYMLFYEKLDEVDSSC